jgi:hypothetical protein
VELNHINQARLESRLKN